MKPITIIDGGIAVLDRADVDTDQIIPKQFLKRIERTGFGEFLFYDWVRSGEISLTKAPILVAGENFGCGSSREHAVWALQDFGYAAVVAPSFAEIFYGNCTKCGVLPVQIPAADVRALMDARTAAIDLEKQTLTFDGRAVHFDIDPSIKHRLLNGLDEIGMTLSHADEISAYEAGRAWPAPATTGL